MRWLILALPCFLLLCSLPTGSVHAQEEPQAPLYTPLIERYILDELKSLRQDVQGWRAEVEKKLADTRLESSDRALRYASDTMNNIFIVITATASLLVFIGWTSLRDMRTRMEDMVGKRVDDITQEYRDRLVMVEEKLRERSDEILTAQEEIARTNEAHSLWMRVGLEQNIQNKITIYDEILKLNPQDAEAFTYKADAVLELGESEWAINLCNKAIAVDPDYGYAYWQLACAHAELGNAREAIEHLRIALSKSPKLRADVAQEASFASLRALQEYAALMEG